MRNVRHNLGVVDEVFQRITAGKLIVEVCGIADDTC